MHVCWDPQQPTKSSNDAEAEVQPAILIIRLLKGELVPSEIAALLFVACKLQPH